MARYDQGQAQALLVERLADKDPVFARNYGACVRNKKYRQLIPSVTAWLVQSALARERRQHRAYQPSRVVTQVERELFS